MTTINKGKRGPRGNYKRFLQNEDEEVPRNTKKRWLLKMRWDDSDDTYDHLQSPCSQMEQKNDLPEATAVNIYQHFRQSCNEGTSSDDEGSVTSQQTTADKFSHHFDPPATDEETSSEIEGSVVEQTQQTGDTQSPPSNSVSDADPNDSSEDCDLTQSPFHDENSSQPLFTSAILNHGQLLLLVMAFVLKYNLTGSCLEDLLGLLNLIVPGSIVLSKYLFNKQFSMFQNQIQKHFYCNHCLMYIGLDAVDECPGCNSPLNLNEIEKHSSFFLYAPIEPQLKNLLQKKGIAEFSHGHNNRENLQDIHQGMKYQELFQDLSEFDLSITLNCDEVPLYKSSKTSFWPIQFMINELPKDQRSKNVVLCGVWVGNNKPKIDLFFKPFVDELKKLGNEGFQWQDETGLHTSRVHCAVVSCDAVARCLLQNFHQFNGSFGCGTCLHEGEMVQRGEGFARVYPVRGVNVQRTARGTVHKAREAVRINAVYKGVKGPSVFSVIPKFNIIDGFVPDFMHSVILGVVRQFNKLWFDSQNHVHPFYIGKSVTTVSKMLESLKPPSDMVRLPRSLSERKFWKATEWRNFLFFSPLLLMNILPDIYLRHWWLLVYAIVNLSSENVSVAMVDKSRAALLKFVIKVESLYGIEHVSYNVHQLTHLAQYVLNWGPLWATSAFPFESNNQLLKRFCHGTKGIGNQIMKNCLIWSHLNTISEDSLSLARDNVKEFYKQLSQHGGKHIKNALSTSSQCTALGLPVVRHLSDLEKAALITIIPNCHLHSKVSSFNRFMLRKTLVHSEGYSVNIKQNDSVIALTNGMYVAVASLFLIKQGTLTTPAIVGSELKKCNFSIRDRDVSANLAEFFHKVTVSSLVAFSPDLFKCKCLLMTHGDFHFVIEWPENDLVR